MSVAEQLRIQLSTHAITVMELFKEWDVDHSASISREEFQSGVRALGFAATDEAVNDVFDSIDEDHGGQLDFSELKHALQRSPAEIEREIRRKNAALRAKVAGAKAKTDTKGQDLRHTGNIGGYHQAKGPDPAQETRMASSEIDALCKVLGVEITVLEAAKEQEASQAAAEAAGAQAADEEVRAMAAAAEARAHAAEGEAAKLREAFAVTRSELDAVKEAIKARIVATSNPPTPTAASDKPPHAPLASAMMDITDSSVDYVLRLREECEQLKAAKAHAETKQTEAEAHAMALKRQLTALEEERRTLASQLDPKQEEQRTKPQAVTPDPRRHQRKPEIMKTGDSALGPIAADTPLRRLRADEASLLERLLGSGALQPVSQWDAVKRGAGGVM